MRLIIQHTRDTKSNILCVAIAFIQEERKVTKTSLRYSDFKNDFIS